MSQKTMAPLNRPTRVKAFALWWKSTTLISLIVTFGVSLFFFLLAPINFLVQLGCVYLFMRSLAFWAETGSHSFVFLPRYYQMRLHREKMEGLK